MSNRLNWGVLSTARINQRFLHAAGASPRSHVAAVASRSDEVAVRYARDNAIPAAYGSYQRLLADPSIDAVYISLPNALHADWAVAAAQAGKHVYCEKPLATSAADVDRIAAAAAAAGVVVSEACAMSYHSQTALIASLVQNGDLGDVRLIRGWFGFTLPSAVDPRLEPALAGGSLWDIGCYPIGLTRAVLRQTPIDAAGSGRIGPTGVDLSSFGQVRYDGGAVLQVATSMDAPGSWSFEVIGSRGVLAVSEPYLTQIGATSEVTLRAASVPGGGTFGDEPLPPPTVVARFERPNAYVDALAAFERTVLDGASPVHTLAESRWNVSVVEALHRSARLGQTVPVAELS